MITLEEIYAAQLEAARLAAHERRIPLTLWPADLASRQAMYKFCKAIPFLGNYVPKGYQRVNVQDVLLYHLDYFFVDATGAWENIYHEPALSIGQLRDMLVKLYHINVLERPIGLNGRYDVPSTYGLGIWEAGQFQVNIALYQEAQNAS